MAVTNDRDRELWFSDNGGRRDSSRYGITITATDILYGTSQLV